MNAVSTALRTCTKCGGHRFNGWDRYMDCRNACAKVRQARVRKNGGSHTRAEWERLLAESPTCAICGCAWDQTPKRPDSRYANTWTKGYKVRVLHGGTSDISNLQSECYECNFRKLARQSAVA